MQEHRAIIGERYFIEIFETYYDKIYKLSFN